MTCQARRHFRECITVLAICAMLLAGSAGAQPSPGGLQPAGKVILTQAVLDAWLASCRDPRVAGIYGSAAPELTPDAELGDIVDALRNLANDKRLDELVKLHGFIGARAWVDATLKINSGIMGDFLGTAREALESSPFGKDSPEYKTALQEIDREFGELRALWGALTPEEQDVASDSMDDIRLIILGQRPLGTEVLALEQLQRWIAADKDEPIDAVLDLVREGFSDEPIALKRLILTASVSPEVDAAAQAHGFAGAHEWAQVTAKIIGAMLERSVELDLVDLDDAAADHPPDEYERLLQELYGDLADIRLAFGTRSDDDMALVGKYYKSVRRALDDDTGKQQAAL